MACDFLTVETVQLKTLYVLLCIEVGTRKVRLAGVTTRPDSAWVTQQGRNLAMDLDDQQAVPKFLIHDRDLRFSGPFDEVLRTEEVWVLRTPVQAPKANAIAERWVQTVRAACLDWTLVLGRRHLERLLGTYRCRRPGPAGVAVHSRLTMSSQKAASRVGASVMRSGPRAEHPCPMHPRLKRLTRTQPQGSRTRISAPHRPLMCETERILGGAGG